ncbi:hypothetical protein ACET3Z_025906 [Daucus carota]
MSITVIIRLQRRLASWQANLLFEPLQFEGRCGTCMKGIVLNRGKMKACFLRKFRGRNSPIGPGAFVFQVRESRARRHEICQWDHNNFQSRQLPSGCIQHGLGQSQLNEEIS